MCRHFIDYKVACAVVWKIELVRKLVKIILECLVYRKRRLWRLLFLRLLKRVDCTLFLFGWRVTLWGRGDLQMEKYTWDELPNYSSALVQLKEFSAGT